jgi:hypothetical protein
MSKWSETKPAVVFFGVIALAGVGAKWIKSLENGGLAGTLLALVTVVVLVVAYAVTQGQRW